MKHRFGPLLIAVWLWTGPASAREEARPGALDARDHDVEIARWSGYRSKQALRRQLEVEPDEFGYERLSDLCIRDGEYENALIAIQASLAINKRNWGAWVSYSTALFRMGSGRLALVRGRRAVDLAPGHPQPLLNLGLLQWNLGQLGVARGTFEKLLKLSPDHVPGRRLHRELLEAIAREQKAEPASR